MRDRRIGKFTVDLHLIDNCADQVRVMMKDVLVLRAECLHHKHCIEYVGIHPAFSAIPDGYEPPPYTAEVRCKGDGTVEKVTWRPV